MLCNLDQFIFIQILGLDKENIDQQILNFLNLKLDLSPVM